MVDDADPIAQALRLLHVVGGVEHPDARRAQLLHAREDRVTALRIDADRRLVEDQQGRPVKEPDADVEAPLHTTGELTGSVVGRIEQPDGLQDLRRPRRETTPAEAVQTAEESKVLRRGEIGIDGQILWHVADRSLGVAHLRVQIVTGDLHRPRVSAQQPAQHRNRRRLPRAVRTEQAIRLPGTDLETDTVDHRDLAIPFGQIPANENSRHRHRRAVDVAVQHGSRHASSLARSPTLPAES